ncbi:MAG: type II toxin-antitoxin system Phd/YefM family antitoxin [bacterium]|nr:type II toxin-antitoxin system Phd/YefM family antitoxin [bacterium]
MDWKLSEAKNKLTEVVNLTLSEGPQFIRRREDGVVLISEEDYNKLLGKTLTLKEFLLEEDPLLEDLDLSRSKDKGREVNL